MNNIQAPINRYWLRENLKKTARSIENELDVQGVINRLYEYPQKIRRQQDVIQNAQRQLEQAKDQLELAKAEIFSEIVDEVNEKGKPVYSNEAARNAEFKRRAAENEEYQRCLKEYQEAEEAYNTAKHDLDQLFQEYYANRETARLIAAKINLMGAL